jgi:hypothetical protein
MRKPRTPLILCLVTACLFIVLAGCATNPVTGKSELMLVSEEQ